MIYYNFEDVDQPDINIGQISAWIRVILDNYERIEKQISFIFCSDNYLLHINREYLKHDYFTDIITFDYCEGNLISGDIFISVDTVRSNAKDYNTSFNDELHRVIIHGILHLVGFKDKSASEAQMMRQMENEALELLKTI